MSWKITRWALTFVLTGAGIAAAQPVQQSQEGLHYWAAEHLDAATPAQRGTANGNGNIFNNLLLAPNARYRFWVLRAEDLFVGNVVASTGRAGSRLTIPGIAIGPTNLYDTDGDRLPDLAEYIVGTDPSDRDSDDDGIEDGAEVVNGTDPVGGLNVRTGVIASIDTPGIAVDVCNANDRTVIADSATGFTAFTVFNRMNPRALARYATRGVASRVACEGDLVAVAEGADGVEIVDISDPPAARLVGQVATGLLGGAATSVVLVDRLVYVGTDADEVVSVDGITGGVLERVEVDDDVVDLAVEGTTLYALTRGRLHIIPLDRDDLAVSASLPSPFFSTPNDRLFVGGGLAYAVHGKGMNTFDVSDPDAPAQITSTNTGEFGWSRVVLNGSGLAIGAVGPNFALDGARRVKLYDARDPAETNRVLAIFDTPGEARSISIFNGLAYVADHTSGVSVVNYRSYDSLGVAPTIQLTGSIDLAMNPAAAEEGKLLVITASVTDDVQVRNVEFYIDGVKVATDGNFPFEYRFTSPLLAAQASFTLRARASDTGGNATDTEEIVVTLLPDATSPRVTRVSPRDGALLGSVASIAAFVDEPLNQLTLVPGNFTLMEAGGDEAHGTSDDVLIQRGTLGYRATARALLRSFAPPLPNGRYRATVTSGIADLAGNGVNPPFSWEFRVFDASADTDNDGVPDSIEAALGLDPNLADTDGDGTPDGEEDFDMDGLGNAAEVILGYDPTDDDTDDNGILDGAEDRDLDGLADGQEIALGTDPMLADTDGDGFNDGDEVAEGSDPLDIAVTPLRFAFAGTVSVRSLDELPADTAIGGASARNTASIAESDSTIGTASVRNERAVREWLRTTEGPSFLLQNQ